MNDQEAIPSNGKTILNYALPGDQGGNALVLRESHRYTRHLNYLAEHMQELASEHRVGMVGIEMASYMMAFHWAYRDAAPGPQKEAAREQLIDAYAAYYAEYPKLAERQAKIVLSAVDQGVDVACVDARGTRAEDASEPYTKAAEKIYRRHPEYADKIDAVEYAMDQMTQKGVPMEVIASTVLSRLADPSRNMIAIAGYNHINGSYLRQDENYRSDGIFDEGIAHAPAENGTTWRVTDGFIGTPTSIRYMANAQTGAPGTQDQIDFVWSLSTDDTLLWRPTEDGQWELLSNNEELTRMLPQFDPHANAPTAEQLFGDKLDPSQIAGVQQAIADLQAAFQKPAAPPVVRTDSPPLVSR